MEVKPDCPDFKPSPLAAWMCDNWICSGLVFEDVENKISPWCREGLLCKTKGLKYLPKANYQPGDNGETD